MTFLHPWALAGLVAAAIPALLHLFERRVPLEAEFPPLRYLTEAERQSARRLKLRHLLLLILRTAVILAIVLAAARPLVRSRLNAAAGHEPTALVVILDDSPSSGLVVDGQPVLERLKTTARASLARATTADRVWLVLADGVARAGSREALVATVDSAGVSPYRLDLSAAVRAAILLVNAEPLPGREIHIVSDLQRTAFGAGRVTVPRGVRVQALASPDRPPPANRGVGSVRVTDGAVVIGVVGTPGADAGRLTVRVGGREVGHALAAPGSTVTIMLPPLGVGWWLGEAALDADELRADDRRLFVWRVAPPARVSSQPDAGPFVAAALAVLEQGQRIQRGPDVAVADRPDAGRLASVVMPPGDPALIGQANRALGARGGRWRFGAPGSPGPIASPTIPTIAGAQVVRRYRLEGNGVGPDDTVLASVNGEPWLVRGGGVVLLGSRLDTAWTALPAAPAFVPFVDALVNRLARGEAPVAVTEGPSHVEFQIRGADTVGARVFGMDARESDLTPAPARLVAEVLGADVLDGAAFAAARFAGAGRGRLDASGPLLALAVLLAAVELGIATLTR
ncbi:MAG TPA: BatA domain-containing protein [Gemmatimonadales bacterium]|nr:BatA domain-containing protein [Gemmatimonadales bacterium]